jgi:hypothetical protein
VRAYEVKDLDARACVARSRALLDAARDGSVHLAASIVRGPCAALGALQRPEAVVRETPWVHRATTGAEAWIGGAALWWSLALPRVDALFPDATSRTLLNRNVRGFLRGLTSCGALAHYFGRDVIAVRHRPAALLGYELLDDGRVLLDVIAGWDAPVTLPRAWQAPRRASRPRAEGLALAAVISGREPADVAARVLEAVAARSSQTLDPCSEPPALPEDLYVAPQAQGAVEVPIGWLDAGTLGGAPWLGGDVLTATAWLRRAAEALAQGEALPEDAVLEGALPEDLARAWAARDLSP